MTAPMNAIIITPWKNQRRRTHGERTLTGQEIFRLFFSASLKHAPLLLVE